jgi:hypothetical protein
MKKLITAVLPFCAILVVSHACKQEEDTAPAPGKAPFSTIEIFIDLRYPEQVDFDSALMVLKDSASEISCKLTLNNQTHTATGYFPGVAVGDRKG